MGFCHPLQNYFPIAILNETRCRTEFAGYSFFGLRLKGRKVTIT